MGGWLLKGYIGIMDKTMDNFRELGTICAESW